MNADNPSRDSINLNPDTGMSDNSSGATEPVGQTSDEQPNQTLSAQNPPESCPEPSEPDFVVGQGVGIEVSASKMHATLELSSHMAHHYDLPTLVNYLKQNHVAYGIDESIIQRILDEKLFNQAIEIAKGTPAINGDDGYIDWDIDLSILDGAKLVEKGGRVDWKQRHHIIPVQENQPLARLIDPTDGNPGKNIHGEEIPPTPGKPTKLSPGKGVRLSDDGKEMVADLKGVVCREGEKISITDTYTQNGDVNFASGNIYNDTTVVIKGGVLTDFVIDTQQDIHIDGIVEGAQLKALGNIYLNGGVQGVDKAKILAGGDVIAKFVNNAVIESNGNIFVNGPVTNSLLRAKQSVFICGSKAIVLGGHIKAEETIEATTFGSEMGVKTILEIGAELLILLKQKNDAIKKLQSLKSNYSKLKQASDQMKALQEKTQLNKQQQEMKLKIIRSGMLLQRQMQSLNEEIQNLDIQIENGRRNQKGIAARDIFHPGVVIKIMDETKTLKNETHKAIFAMPRNLIETYPYFEEQNEEKKANRK